MEKAYISKIHCRNFRSFADREIDNLGPGVNIFIGDNDTGKSSILLALDLVMRASFSKVQNIGLERLMNRDAVLAFLGKADRTFSDLPELVVDLYIENVDKIAYYGEHNAKSSKAHGISLLCRPCPDFKDVINEALKSDNEFPFEYYMTEFQTFSGAKYSRYSKILQHVDIDNTRISSDAASRSYIQDMYLANIKGGEAHKHQIKYRQAKTQFTSAALAELNTRLEDGVAFSVRNDSKSNLETDLTIKHRDIDIDNVGMGMQCFIRTTFALSKKANIDVVLLEEPENHLSQTNMKKLVDNVSKVTNSQVFIATHSSYICSRLDLRNAIMFGLPSAPTITLKDISEATAKFFMKAPQNSLLEFVTSPRTILVEGDAEFGLLPVLFNNIVGRSLEASNIAVIAVGGIRFRRYLDVAKTLTHKVAVITDNDGATKSERLESYRSYADGKNIQVFFDDDENRRTFEVCIYQDNQTLCDGMFAKSRKSLSVQSYMLMNKSEVAFLLADSAGEKLNVPQYLKDAIEWISA